MKSWFFLKGGEGGRGADYKLVGHPKNFPKLGWGVCSLLQTTIPILVLSGMEFLGSDPDPNPDPNRDRDYDAVPRVGIRATIPSQKKNPHVIRRCETVPSDSGSRDLDPHRVSRSSTTGDTMYGSQHKQCAAQLLPE